MPKPVELLWFALVAYVVTGLVLKNRIPNLIP